MSETALEAREPSAKYLAGAEPALVRGFELLATAQGGVSRLRGLIRSLAVQGLLLSQSGAGESANILLDRLGHLKHARVASSRAKAVQPTNDMLARLTGFALPYGWGWASLSELGSFASGKTPSTGKPGYWNGRIPWVTPKDMKASRVIDSEDHISEEAVADGLAIVPESAVLIVVRSGILRRTVPVAIASVLCTVNQDLKALTLYEPAMAAYVQLLISGFEPFILRNLTKIGTTVESIKFDEFAACQFPIPPLAEQHRIVARVEELMKLCDALEQSGRLADEQHARLTSTLFDALAASESAHALAENWQRVAEHFDLLLDRPEAIDALEQTILQLAARGLLVPQRESDEPADRVRSRVGKERQLQFAQAPLTIGKAGHAVSDGERTFTVPNGWSWVNTVALDSFYSIITAEATRRQVTTWHERRRCWVLGRG